MSKKSKSEVDTKRMWKFDRFRLSDGQKMAEGIGISKASSEWEAYQKALDMNAEYPGFYIVPRRYT